MPDQRDRPILVLLTSHWISMLGVALVTLMCLALLYRPLSRGALAIDDWVVSTNRRLALFAVSLFLFPALLVGAGFAIGPLT